MVADMKPSEKIAPNQNTSECSRVPSFVITRFTYKDAEAIQG